MNAQIADEHVFVDSTVVKKAAAPTNKDPKDIKMKFPPSIEAKDLILKPIDGKKPRRSPNAFIIYRKLFVQTARANGYNLQMTEISKTASRSWENEADYVKKYYKRLAKDAYKYRSEMFPKTDRRKKRQQWNIVSFKSTSDEQESLNDTDSSTSSTSNQSPLFSSPMLPEVDVFNATDDNHINNNDHFHDHIIFNNLSQNNLSQNNLSQNNLSQNNLSQNNEINPFPFNIPLNALNALELYAAASAIDLQQNWSSEDLIDPQTWSSPELSTSNSFSPEINEFNDFSEIGEINESYSPHIIHNEFYNYDETINQNIFDIDTNTCINYNNEINSNNPLWFQPGNLSLALTEQSDNNSPFYL